MVERGHVSEEGNLIRNTLSFIESTSHTLGYRVRLRMQHILKDVAELAYEQPEFFADVPPPHMLVSKGNDCVGVGVCVLEQES